MNKSIILVFGWLALILLIVNVFISITIVKKLNSMGEKANLRWLRFKAFGYAKHFKEITIKNTGKPDNLYYLFVISSILFFLCLSIGIILVAINK